MKARSLTGRLAFGLLLVWVMLPQSVLACATCFGASDDPLAKGMNMGILSLLAVIVFVLAGIAAFGIFLARRASQFPDPIVAAQAKSHSNPVN